METHPAWLKKSAIPLTIVCGPPCSGKTTYARQHSVTGDTVIDLDAIRKRLKPSWQPWSSKYEDYKLLHRAIRVRNMMLAGLHKATGGRAYFVIAAPHQKERDWWQAQLGGVVMLLNPGIQVCRQRAIDRGTPLAAAGVDAWAVKAERHWYVPTYRQAIGVHGWPLDEDEDDADIILRRALSLKPTQ